MVRSHWLINDTGLLIRDKGSSHNITNYMYPEPFNNTLHVPISNIIDI